MQAKNREMLLYLSIKNHGDWSKIYADLVSNAFKNESEEDIKKAIDSITCDYITILDKEYPDYLKQGYHPPFVLFYKGNINLLKDKSKVRLAILNTKEQSVEDYNIADYLLDESDEDFVFITGATTNLDSTILIKGNPTIEVLPYPVDNVPYGKLNQVMRYNGLILSEYPTGTQETQDMHITRNRIIASIADYPLILSCKQQSSSLMIVSYMLEQGKDILVVPQSPLRTELCNNLLIGEGAIPVWNKDILKSATTKW